MHGKALGQINNVLLILGITALMAVITSAVAYFVDVLSLIGTGMASNPLDLAGQQVVVAERQD